LIKKMRDVVELACDMMNFDGEEKGVLDKKRLRLTWEYFIANDVLLSIDEAKVLLFLVPDEVDWKVWYEHVIYSRVKDEDRFKLREAFGVEGYYHPSSSTTREQCDWWCKKNILRVCSV
jgi:hypothetical protein